VIARDQGSALVVTLVLLAGLGALALAAAAAAMTALALTGHQQMSQNAFEGAETGIANALLQAAAARRAGTHAGTIRPDDLTAATGFHTDTREAGGPGALPAGFSIGENEGTFAARHFFITSDARSGRGTRARLEQGFYLVVPAS
jgi:Tfp pilus assembly protein PilX